MLAPAMDIPVDKLRLSTSPGALGESLSRSPREMVDLSPHLLRKIFPLDSSSSLFTVDDVINHIQQCSETNPAAVTPFIPAIKRLLDDCPIRPIRLKLLELHKILVNKGLTTNEPAREASHFFPSSVCPTIPSPHEDTQAMFNELFLSTGRVGNLFRLFAMHPTFFSRFLSSYHTVMLAAGPLPLPWRNYIATLVCFAHPAGKQPLSLSTCTVYFFVHVECASRAPVRPCFHCG
mmetsp:Transcript_53436/g.134272  ORF Transcript_53436/g.134272 Transcript_53436/m.134272 type:complete len:234 (+) Transcript_53436:117-818(+)